MPFRELLREDAAQAALRDHARTFVWTLAPDGVVTHAAGAGPFGLRRSRAVDRPLHWCDFWPDEGRATADRALATAASGDIGRFRLVAAGRGKAGRAYWETVVAPVRGADGAIVSLLAHCHDVTEETEQQALLDTVVQLLPLPVVVRDLECGRYILWNRAAEQAFRIPADAVVGQSTIAGLDSRLAAALDAAEQAAVAGGDHRVSAVACGDADRPRILDLHSLATFDDFGPHHLISLCVDVTERHATADALRRAMEAAEHASAAKSRFLAVMSHELRTPLNGVMAGADLLTSESLTPRGQELTGLIQASSASLERLLSGILDLAAIEAGGTAVQVAPFQLGSLVREVTGLARLAADEKGVAVRVQLDAAADIVVAGDAVKLRQAITNLLANATKFTERGEVVLAVDRQGERVVFSISDTGIGFDASVRSRIFEPFQQADTSIARRFGGAGLGLAITSELVRLMGGGLACESTPGEGSRFWFDLPLPAVAPLQPAEPAQAAPPPPADLQVLAADDHPTNRRVVELMLSGAAEVVSVADGLAAFEAYRSGAFDAVIMDMQMPVMDGLEAVRRIRAFEASTGRPRRPILMLSANIGPEHLAASRDAGADLHIGKPITAERLFAALGEILE